MRLRVTESLAANGIMLAPEQANIAAVIVKPFSRHEEWILALQMAQSWPFGQSTLAGNGSARKTVHTLALLVTKQIKRPSLIYGGLCFSKRLHHV